MKHGVAMNVCHLKIGDIVRPIRGGYGNIGQPNIEYTLTDGVTKRKVETLGWGSLGPGNPNDFRDAYDTMTVYKLDDNYVSFLRPYLHLNAAGQITSIGIEYVNNVSRTSNTWYELLS